MYLRNWQSFRNMADESQHSQLLTPVKWWAGTRSEVSRNAICLWIKRPQTNTNEAKRLDMLECCMPSGFRQNNDRHMRKKAVTIGLHQSPPPVAQLNFESQQFGINALDEIVRRDTGTRSRQTIRIPTDRDKISDAV